jgi:hypothetical protein
MRPATIEEMKALPIGPAFGTTEKIIDGKKVRLPVAPQMKASFFGNGDLMGYTDETGIWSIAQYADGTWFRQRGR